MPVYDYKCAEHGIFHDLATMDKAAEPCKCPQCGKMSSRIIMIPPEVLAMAPDAKKSLEKNETAQHQPIISSVDSRQEAAERKAYALKHGKGKSCGCSSHAEADTSSLKQQVVYLPDGSKIFPSQRPWMISH